MASRSRSLAFPALIALVASAVSSAPVHAQCDHWQSGFGLRGSDGYVDQVHGFRDASGPTLFVRGGFQALDGVPADRAGRWNGTQWSALPLAAGERIDSFATFDDGTGAAVYASILTASSARVARWNGAGWTSITATISLTSASARVFLHGPLDDGSGSALYLVGTFSAVDGVAAQGFARWNGASWQGFPAGVGFSATPFVFDDGGGRALYASTPPSFVRWNGAAWTAALAPLPGNTFDVAVYDDGSGPALYASGAFGPAAQTFAVARWTSGAWSPLTAIGSTGGDLFVHDFGAGPVLCVALTSAAPTGGFDVAVQSWNASAWSPIGATFHAGPAGGGASSLTSVDLGGGPELVIGGTLDRAGDVACFDLARFDGAAWRALGVQHGVDAAIDALALHDDGSGIALYAAGTFQNAGGVAAPGVARWRASSASWSRVGDVGTSPRALASHDDGSGRALFAAGVTGVQRWNGTTWTAVGTPSNGFVRTLVTADFGAGRRLVAGGSFSSIGGSAATHVAVWDGTSWGALGAGVPNAVTALAEYDDGAGAQLYAAISSPLPRVLRWNGSIWQNVGSAESLVETLIVHDDGGGPALIAGGNFQVLGGAPNTVRVARFKNGAWSGFGQGLGSGGFPSVFALASHDDGNGPALYAGGDFASTLGSVGPTRKIARWNGTNWSAVGAGVGSANSGETPVRALATYVDSASGAPALFVGGSFAGASDVLSRNVAVYVACAPAPVSFCFGDGSATPCPCGNSGTAGRGCRNSTTTTGALLTVSGTLRVSSDSATLSVSGSTNQLVVFLQGTERDNGGLGTPLFDGLRCVDGAIVRLGAKLAVAGAAAYPNASELPLSVRGGIPAGVVTTRHYQAFYRDASASWCTPGTANWSNGVTLTWLP